MDIGNMKQPLDVDLKLQETNNESALEAAFQKKTTVAEHLNECYFYIRWPKYRYKFVFIF